MGAIVIGSGLSGTTASRLLADNGVAVNILESRSHASGNCRDTVQNGTQVHRYGPHLFHTNDVEVWEFLSRFTEWMSYQHKVVADTGLGRISIPYTHKATAQLGRELSDEEIRNLIFVDYSEKQWGVPWAALPAAITGRVPSRRDNADDRYFTDKYQAQPKEGYSKMFERMLEGIPAHLGAGKDEWRKHARNADLVIYTGKIDEYFNYCYGRLPYRSLRFEHFWSPERLPHAVINQCDPLGTRPQAEGAQYRTNFLF